MLARHDIRALAIGARFEQCCQRQGSARVLSVHNRVINLVAQDELLALALPQAGGSSRFLSLNVLPDVRCGNELQLNRTELIVGKKSIDLRTVPRWQNVLPPDACATLTPELFAEFAEAVRDLAIHSEINVDAPLAPQTVTRFLGLGPGLTPAGDDILLGYLAADNHLGENRAWTQAMHVVVASALDRTTMLSAQLLKNALECDYHETVQRVLAVLCGLSSENLLSALRRLTQVGASSGESTVYGMWMALQRIALEWNSDQLQPLKTIGYEGEVVDLTQTAVEQPQKMEVNLV